MELMFGLRPQELILMAVVLIGGTLVLWLNRQDKQTGLAKLTDYCP
jgi:hypothetical protein